ncbi:TPA: hypothetical protein N0F65_010199 [Lagenidium giganteum]|uniref:RNA-binding protein 5 n=1 Tax=Lagenidium giganteum TaxID=4803 RepID=A0AAV2YLY4_9STRA|nr:TPA: hypothetical protein N0F65_010199 [Lagenidium giganteum]
MHRDGFYRNDHDRSHSHSYGHDHRYQQQQQHQHPPHHDHHGDSDRSWRAPQGADAEQQWRRAPPASFERQRTPSEAQHGGTRVWDASPSPSLILRGLLPSVTDRMILDALASFRPVKARVMYHKVTGEPRGFAFVEFETTEAATEVVNACAFQPLRLEHRNITIGYADNSRAPPRQQQAPGAGGFQTNPSDWICEQCNATTFARRTSCFKCQAPRTETCLEVGQLRSQHSDGRGDGYQPSSGYAAHSSKTNGHADGESQAEVPSNVLVVRMLPPEVEEGELQVAFAEFNGVQDIRLIRDRATNESRGFGFVEFADIEAATTALRACSNLVIDGADVRVSYARESYKTGYQPARDGSANGHSINPIAAAAMEQAQWSMGNGYAQAMPPAQRQEQSQTAALEDVNALLESAAAAAMPHLEEPKKEWPLPFETGGGMYVFASEVGLYYDTDSMFYYDPLAKLYYNSFTGVYYQCRDGHKGTAAKFEKFVPPAPIDDSAFVPADCKSPVGNTTGTAPPAPVTTGVALKLPQGNKKKSISFGLKAVGSMNKVFEAAAPAAFEAPALPTSQKDPAAPVVVQSVSAGMKRKHAAEIARWSQVQRESAQKAGGGEATPPPNTSPASSVTHQNPKNNSELEKILEPTAVPICLLCRRKFGSMELLRKHETMSQLHKDNLAKAKQDKEAMAAQYDRDRDEKEARKAKKSKPNDATNTATTAATPAPNAPAADSSSALEGGLGAKMLKMMGWKSGEGLGKHGTGITAPIAATGNAGGNTAGLGTKTLADKINVADVASYKERLQQMVRARVLKERLLVASDWRADFLATLEKVKRWQRVDLVVVLEFVDLRLGDIQLGERHIWVLGGKLLHERQNLRALAAPRRHEVGNHRLARRHERLEVLLRLDHGQTFGRIGLILILQRREVLLTVLRVALDRLLTRLPVRWAHLAVLCVELQRLDQTQRLVHAAADWQVVDRHLLQHALWVDDEQATQGNAGVFKQHPILGRNDLGQVRHKRNAHTAEAATAAWQTRPRQVRLSRVHRHSHQLRVELFELAGAVVERDDLGRAHKNSTTYLPRYWSSEISVISSWCTAGAVNSGALCCTRAVGAGYWINASSSSSSPK